MAISFTITENTSTKQFDVHSNKMMKFEVQPGSQTRISSKFNFHSILNLNSFDEFQIPMDEEIYVQSNFVNSPISGF